MDASLTELLPRLFGSMAVVIALMWGAARVMKDRRLPGMSSAAGRAEAKRAAIEVIARHGVGKNATVSVVRMGERTLVLGVTDHQVNLLVELENESSAPPLALVPASVDTHGTGVQGSAKLPTTEQAWKGLLEQVREKTVRRA